jgi:hypothetical protein
LFVLFCGIVSNGSADLASFTIYWFPFGQNSCDCADMHFLNEKTHHFPFHDRVIFVLMVTNQSFVNLKWESHLSGPSIAWLKRYKMNTSDSHFE